MTNLWVKPINRRGAFHFGTIAQGSGQPRGVCPYRMGQWAKVKCTQISLAPLRPSWEKGLGDEGLIRQRERLKIFLAPLRPSWEKGLGDEGLIRQKARHPRKPGHPLPPSLPPERSSATPNPGDLPITAPHSTHCGTAAPDDPNCPLRSPY